MPSRDWRLRISDILECIDKINRYIEGMSFEDFAADDRTVDAVLRRIEIIGEATRHVPDEVTSRYPDIPWEKMRGMRNVVVHEYFGVSLRIIWRTIRAQIPPLADPLKHILRS